MALGVGTGVAAFAIYAGYYKTQVDNLADDLESGKITVDEWEAAMLVELEKLHTTAYIIGLGGIAAASAEAFAAIGTIVATQSRFLRRWADDLREETKIVASKIKSRAAMYLNAANATLLIALTDALGMPRLPAYPGDGTTSCLANCKCSWQFTRVPGGWDCYWRLQVAEHCPECNSRATTWNPLRVRNGQIEPYVGIALFK